MYDKLENISEVWYNNNGTETKAYEYHYTAYGQMARFVNRLTGKTTSYKYDDDNRLIGFVEYDTDDASDIFAYAAFYDAKSRPGEVRYSLDYTAGTANANADVRYEYRYNETDGTLDYYNITANGFSGHINYIYDGFKRLSGKTYGCADVEDDTTGFYNTVNYTFVTSPFSGSSVATTKTSSLIKTVTSWVVGHASLTYTYDYDSNGNITKIALSNGQEYRYVYDDLGQLLREDNTVLGKTYVYTYDNAGNILTKSTYALTAASVEPTPPLAHTTMAIPMPTGATS